MHAGLLTRRARSFSFAIFAAPNSKSAKRLRKSRQVTFAEYAPSRLKRVISCFSEGLFLSSTRHAASDTPSDVRVPNADQMFIFFSATAQRFFDGTINAF
jgi:hypothetical protein